MGIPVINLKELNGEKRNETMSLLHEACANWGFFWIENHGIDEGLMEKVKGQVKQHYEESLKESFYNSELAIGLGSQPRTKTSDVDWESSFSVRHQPNPTIYGIPNLKEKLCETMKDYVDQLIKLAEKLAEVMSKNLGLENNYLEKTF